MNVDDSIRLDGLIIGGGISGLSAAHWLGLADRPEGWELWEAAETLGGTTGTDHVDGYSVDWGPNGFLDREPLTLRLVQEIGLSSALEPANGSSQKRFILRNSRLHPVPLSPGAILGTGLLSLSEKLRIFGEPFIPARRSGDDESVFDFAARRIGRGAAERFIDPMVSGIFGGLARQLSLPACFPIMREMEERYGGLVRAMIAKQFQKAPNSKKRSGPAGPAGHLTSFVGGLDALIMRLGQRLHSVIRLGHKANRIVREGEWWMVTDGRRRVRARNLICACPTYCASEIFAESDSELSRAFGTFPYAAIAVVASGHRRESIEHALDGFGFLVPRSERVRTLGSIWTSSIFEGRAPEGRVQFRTMLGGAGDPEAIALSDQELWHIIRKELGSLVGIKGDPDFLRTYRWQRGIPQYTLGHIERRLDLERILSRRPGLYVVGNAYYGVSLNECVKMAHRVGEAIRK
jgi:oxygen-dependent protoporphyrinogen oxidase